MYITAESKETSLGSCPSCHLSHIVQGECMKQGKRLYMPGDYTYDKVKRVGWLNMPRSPSSTAGAVWLSRHMADEGFCQRSRSSPFPTIRIVFPSLHLHPVLSNLAIPQSPPQMMCLTTTLRPSPPRLPLNPRRTPFLNNPSFPLNPRKPRKRGCRKTAPCRVELSHDVPFAAAIGACMLTSLVFPTKEVRDEESDAALDTTDARFAVMGIISFIPYFNWLSWVFAWLDTGNRRYAIYALVYLAPYLRSNLSLSPEDSWLPIASIIFGIIHVQLEASIRNGDIQGLQLFSEAQKYFNTMSLNKDISYDDKDHEEVSEKLDPPTELQPGKQQERDEVRQWDVPSSRDREHIHSDWDDNDDRVDK
ncbi:hypothetical protein MLD38_027691 [Melastoma candidum]|uniref:Uncharacterized protein n=1 Tax=Melastoma candidum TaxID=119954 RepID=A0ACB9P3H4_9MYRT|nr:hypothetical protein MLD38_027691 [Melastoma candidum]